MTIKEMRKATGLTQRAFGDKFKISETNIGHWEQGVAKPLPYVEYMIGYILELEAENKLLRQRDKEVVASEENSVLIRNSKSV